jgi:hypothetical protein
MTATVQELDRLVSKTVLDPVTKRGLRIVRRAIETGRAGEVVIADHQWTVPVDSPDGTPIRVSFRLRKPE